jgi:hypothetical protein
MKPLVAVMTAILFCRPTMPHATAGAYAKIVVERSAKLGIDPLMVVAIGQHESDWFEHLVSKDGEDHGIGGIRARYRAACVKDKDPVHAPSAACAAEKKRLLDGSYNLGAIFDAIEWWMTTCKQKTGSAKEELWLAGYAGLSRPKIGKWCGVQATAGKASPTATLPTVPKVVREFLRLRRALRLRLEALPPGN